MVSLLINGPTMDSPWRDGFSLRAVIFRQGNSFQRVRRDDKYGSLWKDRASEVRMLCWLGCHVVYQGRRSGLLQLWDTKTDVCSSPKYSDHALWLCCRS